VTHRPFLPPGGSAAVALGVALLASAPAAHASAPAPWELADMDARSQARKAQTAGEYRAAASALEAFSRSWSPRLKGGDIPCPPTKSRFRTQQECRSSLQGRLARADEHARRYRALSISWARAVEGKADACRDYLEELTRADAGWSVTYAEKLRAMKLVVDKSPEARAFVERWFPARVELEAAPPFKRADSMYLLRALERKGEEAGLRIMTHGDTPSVLRVTADVEENDTSDVGIFHRTGMHSYTVRMTMVLERPDGSELAFAPATRSILGINVAHAAKTGLPNVAESSVRGLVDELLFRLKRGEI
jgi:hypothetical protein